MPRYLYNSHCLARSKSLAIYVSLSMSRFLTCLAILMSHFNSISLTYSHAVSLSRSHIVLLSRSHIVSLYCFCSILLPVLLALHPSMCNIFSHSSLISNSYSPYTVLINPRFIPFSDITNYYKNLNNGT